jgi:hypothetical protein
MGRHIPINAGRAFAIHNLTCLRRERDWAPIGPIFISPAPNLPQRFRDWARERKIEKRQLRSLAPVGFFFFGDFVPEIAGAGTDCESSPIPVAQRPLAVACAPDSGHTSMISSRMVGLTYSMRSKMLSDLLINLLLLLRQHHAAFEDAGFIDALGWSHSCLPLQTGTPPFWRGLTAGFRSRRLCAMRQIGMGRGAAMETRTCQRVFRAVVGALARIAQSDGNPARTTPF